MTITERFNALAGTVPARDLAAGGYPWLTDELIPTDAARARLRRWALAGRPVPDPAALMVLGHNAEPELRAAVARATARLPDAVADHLVAHVLVVVVGHRTNGWVTALPAALAGASEPPQILTARAVGTDMDEFEAIVAHEAAHCWLSLPLRDAAPSNEEYRAATAHVELMDELAREWAVLDPRVLRRARDEWLVARLVSSWGFRGRACDLEKHGRDLCAARAREEQRS